jgi:hypothetical protein
MICTNCENEMDEVEVTVRTANNDGGFIQDEETRREWECPVCQHIMTEGEYL